jgi:sulfatase modifying factor 1
LEAEKRQRAAAKLRELAAEKRQRAEMERQRLAEAARQREETERRKLAEEQKRREEVQRQRLAKEKQQREEIARRKLALALKYKPGSMFKDCTDCPQMVVIPPGKYTIGSSDAEVRQLKVPEQSQRQERPRHTVNLVNLFAVGRYEVTRRQFARFVAVSSRKVSGPCWHFAGSAWKIDPGKSWRHPGYKQSGDHPVTCVSWKDAKAYVKWLAQLTGKPYRLLSNAEWEYAARAGTKTARYWGNDWQNSEGCAYGNLADKKSGWVPYFDCSDGFATTAPVGQYRANNFGLYDMMGNLWEWTEDCWSIKYGLTTSNGRALTFPGCLLRVIRGGAWFTRPELIRSAHRHGYRQDHGNNIIGFRIARTLNY